MGEPFEAIVGADHVIGPLRVPDAALGAVPAGAVTCSVVRPADADEVAACLRVAREARRVVVPRGRGSKLDWGNPVAAEQVALLDLARLDDASGIDADEGVAHVGAGLAVERFEGLCRDLGKTSLLDAAACGAGFAAATVGGTIAADPPGPETTLDRRLRNDLLGLEVALADGTRTRCGGRVVKNVSGFDLTRLYCGSLGTLGVVTAASVRLRARPEQRRAWQRAHGAAGGGLGAAVAECLAHRERGAPLLAAAVLPEADGGATALWCYAGSEAGAAECALRAPGEAADARWAETGARRAATPPAGHARVRVGGRPSDATALARALEDEAGTGALRLLLPLAGWAFAEVPVAAIPGLFERCAERAWTTFVEEAPAAERAHWDAFGPPDDSLVLMRQLKRRFDPHGHLAPGRFWGRL